MATPKDHLAVIKFMSLFHQLRSMIEDDPSDLEASAATDDSVKRNCIALESAATFLSINERRRRELFSAPVDPKFIAAWRDYEDRYASSLAGIFLSDLGVDPGGSPTAGDSEFEVRWENADDDAQALANAVEAALDFAADQVSQDWRVFPDGFVDSIEDGISAWRKLVTETGFNLQDIFPTSRTSAIRAHSSSRGQALRTDRWTFTSGPSPTGT